MLRRGMLGFGRSKVNGLSLVPVPPHIMHAFIDVPHLLRFAVRVLEFTLGVVNFMIEVVIRLKNIAFMIGIDQKMPLSLILSIMDSRALSSAIEST